MLHISEVLIEVHAIANDELVGAVESDVIAEVIVH